MVTEINQHGCGKSCCCPMAHCSMINGRDMTNRMSQYLWPLNVHILMLSGKLLTRANAIERNIQSKNGIPGKDPEKQFKSPLCICAPKSCQWARHRQIGQSRTGRP